MLLCKYCDYYSEMKSSKEHRSVCEFTNRIFTSDVEDMDCEHPCKDLNYQEYLNLMEQSIDIKATA